MQEDTNTNESTGQSNASASESTDSASYQELLEGTEIAAKLAGQSPSEIGRKTILAARSGKNIVIHTPVPEGELISLLASLAELATSESPLCVIVAEHSAGDAIQQACTTLGLECYVDADADDSDSSSSGTREGAQVIVGTAQSLLLLDDLRSKAAIAYGFEASQNSLPSDEVSSVLSSVSDAGAIQTAWLSTGTPLAMSSVLTRHFKTGDWEAIDADQGFESSIAHEYYEVGRDLLSKPTALCDLIELSGRPSTVVFCNSPSDTDLVEVFLRKRGLQAKKLIGHVPDNVVYGAASEIQEGSLQVLVVTDVAARSLPVEDFELVFNHSTPDDPEVYMHRMGNPSSGSKLKKVISLVGTSDLGNFHYLKKVAEFDFEQKELPGEEELAQLAFTRLVSEAQRFSTEDAQTKEFASKILEHESKDALITYLLHNTLKVIPELQSASDRGKRGGRDRDRGRRGRDRDNDNWESRGDRDSGRDRGDRRGRRDRDRDREPTLPPKRDSRIYIGHGSNDGFTEEQFAEILKGLEGGDSISYERMSIRDRYAFVDFAEESSEAVLEKLKEVTFGDSGNLVACKATTISTPQKAPQKDEAGEGQEDANSEGGEAPAAEAGEAAEMA